MLRNRYVVVSCAALFAGCFEEGGDTVKQQAAETAVQGLIAFGDIHSNIMDNPAAAGEALLEFMKWPVAADALVSPPFGVTAMDAVARVQVAPATPVPGCLTQQGKPSCDRYTVAGECEAGGFTFTGTMNRKCSDCKDPRGLCAYGWSLPKLQFTNSAFTLTLATAGSWVGTVSAITPNLSARYTLTTAGSPDEYQGSVSACACTPFTIKDGPPPTNKPRKLVNSSFLVRAIVYDFGGWIPAANGACALVETDGNGNFSVSDSCTCKNDTVCKTIPPEPGSVFAECGDGKCGVEENFETCPVDCPLQPAVCGNMVCEIGEDQATCPGDCEMTP